MGPDRLPALNGGWRDAARPLLGRCAFPKPGVEVVCAVSGGPDSTALLLLAVAAECAVSVVHVDHGLRESAAAESVQVAGLCAALGVGFQAERVEVRPGPNLEARAREARRAVLPAAHATGHTADDRAETVLINLLRGAGVAGLSPLRAGPAHPIVGLRRVETAALCAAAGLTPLEDPMNRDRRFLRVRVRHEVLPLLSDVAGRDVVPLLCRQADVLGEVAMLLTDLAGALDPGDARAVAAAPAPVAALAVRALLGGEHPPDRATVRRVLAVARGEAVGAEVGEGRQVRRSRQRLRVVEPSRSQSPGGAGEPRR